MLTLTSFLTGPQPKRARKSFSKQQDEKKKNQDEELKKKSNKDVQTKDPSDDFEITPPSSPTADEKALMKVQMHRTRKQNTTTNAPVKRNIQTTSDFTRRMLSKCRVLTRQPEGLFVSVTNQDGQRVYLKKNEKITGDKEVRSHGAIILLRLPFHFDEGLSGVSLSQSLILDTSFSSL